jgi:hypothetical protein
MPAYSHAMKTLTIDGILGAGIFLTGCETTVVERRHGCGDGHHGYRDGRYRDGDNGTQYGTRNIERTNVHETDVYETNVRLNGTDRNDVNRTVARNHSQGGQATEYGQASSGVQAHAISKVHQQPSKRVNDRKKKHGGDAQAHQFKNLA